jgi:proteasome accessory factor B
MTRRLEPWGIISYRSRWYVVGHDLDRQEQRLFRLSRVVGEVTVTGPSGAFTVPDGTDIRALTGLLAPETEERSASVLVREGRAVALRHRAARVSAGAAPGWDRLEVGFGRTDTLVDELSAYGPDVVVEDPADLRDAVVERLRGAAGLGGAA